MTSPTTKRVSECFIKPIHPIKESNQICYLTGWDIAMSSMHYIQKGLLFTKPTPQKFIEKLKHSLSIALFHFYPLSGRLVTHKSQHPHSYTIFIDCSNNNPGARFIYATLDVSISHILSPVDVPPFVDSFFDLNKATNHDGHTLPLLSIQVTELIDGVFIGCSMNHCIGDGTSFWNFFNVWSEIFQHENDVHVHVSHNRWFPNGYGPPTNLPFKHHEEFINKYESPNFRDRFFHFTCIAKLKQKANKEYKTTKISSFQALSAHVWRCVTRARGLRDDQKTSCKLAINNRLRMEPPLPKEYFGNSVDVVSTETSVKELVENDLGWAAWKVHMSVVNHDDREVREMIQKWLEDPVVYQLGRHFDPYSITVSSSPRFNMYGNEFGMGKAVAVLSGYANKFDGNVSSYEGYEPGTIDLALTLTPHAMMALESDPHFLNPL
uniref:Uncharacterized acetyltransferase At3g50280-like n=1 Tax=Cicer arietinum TaxID=3827 RepID=A0A3Q7XS26_CICAR|nr:uncharacterized acetyltransferase At3g50280-like [Cicer arietinum]